MLKKSSKKKKTQVKHKIVIVKASSTPRNRGPRECDILFPNYVLQDVAFLIIISIPHTHVSSHQKMDVNV